MATWTNVPNSVLEPGDPIRSVDIIAIKENIIALSEGASGAPKILTNAINDLAVTTAKLANASVTAEKFASGAVTTATASASVGAVGTYAQLNSDANFTQTPGTTRAGSLLNYATANVGGDAPPGTWRLMGGSGTSSASQSVWLRIS
jgi:hypothetical protein